MSGTYSVNRVVILIGILLLAGLLLSEGKASRPALAQELPPRPTLTPSPMAQPDDDDDDDEEPTSIATATPAPTVTPTLTATPVPPTPILLPVTGGQAGDGRVWIVLGLGLMASSVGIARALQCYRSKSTKPDSI